jgi:hypothetical protein
MVRGKPSTAKEGHADKAFVLTNREVAQMRKLVDANGENETMNRLALTRGTLPRLLARLPTRRATVAAVRERLAEA